MTTCISPKWRALLAYNAHLLSPSATVHVSKHLRGCQTCEDGLRAIQTTLQLTHEARLSRPRASIDWDAMAERLDEALFGEDAPKNIVSIYAARPRASQVSEMDENSASAPSATPLAPPTTVVVDPAVSSGPKPTRKQLARGTAVAVAALLAVAAAVAIGVRTQAPPSLATTLQEPSVAITDQTSPQTDAVGAQALTAVVTLAFSTVERISDDSSVVLTRAGNVLPARGRLRTGAKGRVDVRVAEDSGFSLGPNSEASWDFTSGTGGSISLERGAISTNLSKETGAAIKLKVGPYDFSGASGQFSLGKDGNAAVGARVTKGTLAIRRNESDLAKLTAPGEWRSSIDAHIPEIIMPFGLHGPLATSVLPLPASGGTWDIEGQVSLPGTEPSSLLLAPGRFVLASIQPDGTRKTDLVVSSTSPVTVADAYFRSLEASRRRDTEAAASPSAIRGVVARGEQGLKRCFAMADRTEEQPIRRVDARIEIATSGRVSRVHFSDAKTPPSGPFAECLSQEIKGWRFPASSHSVSVELPLKFRVRGTISAPSSNESMDYYPVP